MAQLPPAVRATRVDASIVQQEHGVKPPAGHLLQPPAAEHVTVPWLKHGVRLRADTQLSILPISPTQHVGETRVGGRAPIWRGRGAGERERGSQMEEDENDVQAWWQPRFLLFT